VRKAGVAFLSPQLLDLLRWGRSLSTAKAARELGFRAARDTRAAFEDFTQQRRVLRYAPDRNAYQYEKELEDFIHTRQDASENGDSESNGAAAPAADRATKAPPRPRRSRSLPR
jgi:hypothetical protein